MPLSGTRLVVADRLFEIGAIKFGAFKLKLHQTQPDAPLSPIYLNLRTDRHPRNPGPLTDADMELIGDLFDEQIGTDKIQFDCFADIPDAGEPFGDRIAWVTSSWYPQPRRLRLTKVYLSEDERKISDEVEGDYSAGDVCLAVDEMITQADTKLEACAALVGAGLVVRDVLVLVDREQGGAKQLAAAGYQLHSVFGLKELLDHYVENGSMTPEKAEEVVDYIKANQAA